jgi:hypothetical protein
MFVCTISFVFMLLPSSAALAERTGEPTSGQAASGPAAAIWSGVLVSSACNADEAFKKSPECSRNVPGAKIALYDDTNRLLYRLQPQKAITAHLGDTVTVRGALHAGAIHVISLRRMLIGLPVEAPHLKVALAQSDSEGMPGSQVTLAAEVRLTPEVHIYAPGAKGYKPIQLVLDVMPEMRFAPAIYPKSRILSLPEINERIPVFDGTLRILQDMTVSTAPEFWQSLGKEGKLFTITGKLDYQACDDHMCYLPNSVPVKWQVRVFPLDRNRAAAEIQPK